MDLALFDFDGTITKSNSLTDFLIYSFPKMKVVAETLRILPSLAGMSVRLIDHSVAKERLIERFLGGLTEESLQKRGESYAQEKLPYSIRPEAAQRIDYHTSRGDRVIVVTASCEQWILPWCRKMGIELIATQLEMVDGIVSGKFSSPNCYGAEKVRRIRELVNLEEYSVISAYGDSSGDREMLSIANHPYFRRFPKNETASSQ